MNVKKPKIGIVSDTFLPQIGGAEIHVKNLALNLKKLGYQVEIFTNTAGKSSWGDVKVIRNKLRPKPLRIFFDFKNLFLFLKNVDICHAHYTFYLSFLSAIICKILKKPLVITLHGMGTLDSSVKGSILRKIFRYFSFKLASRVIATSNEMARIAQRYLPSSKIIVIPNGVDTSYFKPDGGGSKDDSKIIVLSMRRLNPKNGVQYLIESIPLIIKEIKNIEFWIAGKEKLENFLRKRVKELKIEKYVKFLGEVPNEKTLQYYQKADIVVFPSSAESTSIACLEAMACKKVIVASALKVYQEMLGNGERGILVKLFDREFSDYDAPLFLPKEKIKLLAKALIEIARDPEKRKKLEKKAREYVMNYYDWKFLISKIEKIYFELIK